MAVISMARFVAAILAPLSLALCAAQAEAAGLTVLPVTIQMAAGQMAATLTVRNENAAEASLQVRPFSWRQTPRGDDELLPAMDLMASPPIATIPAGTTQVVRLVLRRPAQEREASYRILLDQIPPPAAAGMVRIALRLSIPIFAEPATRIAPHLQWRVETDGRQLYLVAFNDGSRHEKVGNISLAGSGGASTVEPSSSPYILPGATRRWRVLVSGIAPAPGAILRLNANADTGPVDMPVTVIAAR
jgi:fimbrial chaperone protein